MVAGYTGRLRGSGENTTSLSKPKYQLTSSLGLVVSFQVFANLYWTPLDVVKQRLQVAPVGASVSGVLGSVMAQNGPLGFWRGEAHTHVTARILSHTSCSQGILRVSGSGALTLASTFAAMS